MKSVHLKWQCSWSSPQLIDMTTPCNFFSIDLNFTHHSTQVFLDSSRDPTDTRTKIAYPDRISNGKLTWLGGVYVGYLWIGKKS